MISEPSFIPYNNTPYMSEVRGVHPLSSSPASSAFFNTPSMNSPPLQNNINTNNTNNTNGLLNEEVTTIFVVGFPEDMQEREFQNMFMFSPGFEAASLKWHCKDQDDDSATAINPTLNGKKQMIGFARFRTRLEALEAVEVISGKKVDQEKGFTLKAEMAKKNLHVKRGSIAPTSSTADTTPSSQSPFEPLSLINNNNSNNNNNNNNNSSNSSNNNTKKLMFGHHEPFTFSPLPSDLLSPMTDYKSDPFALAAEHQPSTMTPTTPVFNDHVFGFRSYSIDGRNSNNHNHNLNQLGIAPRSSVSSITAFTQRLSIKQPHPITPTTNTMTTTTIPEDMSLDPFNYLSKSSPMPIERNTHPYFIDDHSINNHFNHSHPHQLHSEFPSLASSQRSNSILMSPPQRSLPITTNNSNNNSNHSLTHNTTTHLNTSTNITNNINNNNNTNNNNTTTNTATATTTTNTNTTSTTTNSNNNNNNNNNNGISINNNNNTPSNPADQNPPCNTLYVGNLPPNTNEDELRQLFSKCNGYKRMYFRTKPQGPMCFVEFENVMYASQTMSELQGQTLSNSIKGGIRLSFSKNPLFTKPNKTTSSAFDQQQPNQRTLLSSQLNFDPQL